ncbi:MAG: hypothetical protein ACOCXG_04230 [Nanoarchaeota archaeon]
MGNTLVLGHNSEGEGYIIAGLVVPKRYEHGLEMPENGLVLNYIRTKEIKGLNQGIILFGYRSLIGSENYGHVIVPPHLPKRIKEQLPGHKIFRPERQLTSTVIDIANKIAEGRTDFSPLEIELIERTI